MSNQPVHKRLSYYALLFISILLVLVGASLYILPKEYLFFNDTMYHKLYLLNTGIIGIIVVLIENLTLIKIYNFLLGSFEVGALILGRLYFIETGSEFFTNADMILHTDSSLILFFIGLLF